MMRTVGGGGGGGGVCSQVQCGLLGPTSHYLPPGRGRVKISSTNLN